MHTTLRSMPKSTELPALACHDTAHAHCCDNFECSQATTQLAPVKCTHANRPCMACVSSTVHTQNRVESDFACTGGKKKGGSRLANMWSKAPAVKEKPKQATKSKAAAAAPAVDADAALRAAQQVLQTLLMELHSQYTLHSSCRCCEPC